MRTHRSTLYLAPCLLILGYSWPALAQQPEPAQLRTASSHPIQYYLSLPEGWVAGRKWPVVVAIASAERDFLQTTKLLTEARHKRGFIIVTPLVVTNGGAGYRNVPTYHYSDIVWDEIQKTGPFNFDLTGITAIVEDVARLYGGEDKYFITGLEAAGHTVWALLFKRPEAIRGAVLVCPNYLGRWVDEEHISSASERTTLPIRNFIGSNDELCAEGHPIFVQMQQAIRFAESHGYKNVSLIRIQGKGHEQMAAETLDYFSSLVSAGANR